MAKLIMQMLFLDRLGRVLHIFSMTTALRGSPSTKTKEYTAGSKMRLKSSLQVQRRMLVLLMLLRLGRKSPAAYGSVGHSLEENPSVGKVWEIRASVGKEQTGCGIFTSLNDGSKNELAASTSLRHGTRLVLLLSSVKTDRISVEGKRCEKQVCINHYEHTRG